MEDFEKLKKLYEKNITLYWNRFIDPKNGGKITDFLMTKGLKKDLFALSEQQKQDDSLSL